jgi:biotin carboxyl carrier protein
MFVRVIYLGGISLVTCCGFAAFSPVSAPINEDHVVAGNSFVNELSILQEKQEGTPKPSIEFKRSPFQYQNSVETGQDELGRFLLNRKCRVQLKYDIDVPALEGGQIQSIQVVENQEVTPATVIAQLRNDAAKLQKEVAEKNRDVARVDAENRNRITYAQKSLEFAKDIFTRKEKLYKERQSINFVEFREAQYQESQAQLQLDEAHNQQKIAVEKLGVEEVNIQAADDLIKRHQANSLLQKGEVAEIFVQIGEWVNRGDKIARVIQMDTLKINGRAESKVLYPSEIHNRPVEVYLQLPNNRSERFEGQVTRVNLENQVSGMFFFEVKVANRKLDEFWLLRPNADVDIKVRLD